MILNAVVDSQGPPGFLAGVDFGQAAEECCAVNQLGTAAVIRVAIAQGIGDDVKRAQSTKHFNDGAQRFLVYFEKPVPEIEVLAVLDAENALRCGSFGFACFGGATRKPCATLLANVPPANNSTSSGCAPKATRSKPCPLLIPQKYNLIPVKFPLMR